MEKKIEILGTTYTVRLNVPVAEDKSLEDRMGYCQPSVQRIAVASLDDIDGWKDESDESKRRITATTLRHEVLHAFMAESGLWSNSLDAGAWSMNEEMIDWFAIQWPKISKVFSELGCGGLIWEEPGDCHVGLKASSQ